MALKDRMEKALAHANTNQAALAKACGIKAPSVSAWFSGDTKTLRGRSAMLAAKHLGVRQDWLIDGTGPMVEGGATAMAPMTASGGTYPVDLTEHPDLQAVRRARFKLQKAVDELGPMFSGKPR